MSDQDLLNKAVAVIKENDRGDYTVPTKGLYPFQWNWDSCLTALGMAAFDQDRAWREIETLFAHQWSDGMVPHIVFHVNDKGYFPGPDVWGTNRSVPTSGITQPAVAGFAVNRLFERANDPNAMTGRARDLLLAIDRWHAWFFANRDPQGEGLVAIIHPWESGRDNSIDWDQAFERVPTDGIQPYERRDLQHADAAHRPTKSQYDRYLWLLEHFRSLNWDNSKLHDASPFQIVDPGFNAILLRSCADLAKLAERLGEADIAQRNRQWAKFGLAAMERLWSEDFGQYVCWDRVTDTPVDSPSIGGLLAAFAGPAANRIADLADRIEAIAQEVRFLVPSHPPCDARFDAKRYWRGPCWLIVNYMIADGLARAGQTGTAAKIRQSSLDLIRNSGFAEYYDPLTGDPCGGERFTWTAAMVIEFLDTAEGSGCRVRSS